MILNKSSIFNDNFTLLQRIRGVEKIVKELMDQEEDGKNYNATITVDNTTGTPTARVVVTTDDDTVTFNFSLSGIKGEKGQKGDNGTDGNGIVYVTKTASVGLVDTYTIGFSDGSTTTFNVTNGRNGTNGSPGAAGADGKGIASVVKTGTAGLVDTYTITYTDNTTSTFTVTNGADGSPGTPGAPGTNGTDGNGIVSITKTGTAGLVDTYTITYTDGTTSTFDVTNGADGDGKGITSITKTGTVGLVDTYTITYTDNTTFTFTVTNGADGSPGTPGAPGTNGTDGNGIASITKTGTAGLVDTYTITYTDNTTSTFTVTNGADGSPGAPGTPGTNGTDGNGIASITKTGTAGLVDTYTITYTDNTTSTFTVTNGADGQQGTPGTNGQGVPTGGTAGQVLTKVDGTDYNTQWSTPSGGGGGSVEWKNIRDDVLNTDNQYLGEFFNLIKSKNMTEFIFGSTRNSTSRSAGSLSGLLPVYSALSFNSSSSLAFIHKVITTDLSTNAVTAQTVKLQKIAAFSNTRPYMMSGDFATTGAFMHGYYIKPDTTGAYSDEFFIIDCCGVELRFSSVNLIVEKIIYNVTDNYVIIKCNYDSHKATSYDDTTTTGVGVIEESFIGDYPDGNISMCGVNFICNDATKMTAWLRNYFLCDSNYTEYIDFVYGK